jgi:hypothetical protein
VLNHKRCTRLYQQNKLTFGDDMTSLRGKMEGDLNVEDFFFIL